jgi:hypothetical protein
MTQNSNPNLNPRLDWETVGGFSGEADYLRAMVLSKLYTTTSTLTWWIRAIIISWRTNTWERTKNHRDIRWVWWDIWYPLNTDLDPPRIIFYNGHLVLSYNSAKRNMTNFLCFSLVEQSKAILGNMNPAVKRPQISSLSMMTLYHQCCAKYNKHINTRTF